MELEAYVFGIGKSSGFKKGGLIGTFRKFAKENGFSFQEIAIRKEYLSGFGKENLEGEQQDLKVGKSMRKATGRKDIVAVRVILDLMDKLKEEANGKRKVIFVVRSLKKKAEIDLFKDHFGQNFFSIRASKNEEQDKKDNDENETIHYDLEINGNHADYLTGLASFLAEKIKSGSKIDLIGIESRLAKIEINEKLDSISIDFHEKLAAFIHRLQDDVKAKRQQNN